MKLRLRALTSIDGKNWGPLQDVGLAMVPNHPPPVRTSFSDNATKFDFGRLPDGRFYYVGCPSPEPRWLRSPLVLSLSRDGVHFTKHYIIADEPYKMKYPAHYKGGEYGYPSTLVRDGYLYVVVSRQKEAIEAIGVALPQ